MTQDKREIDLQEFKKVDFIEELFFKKKEQKKLFTEFMIHLFRTN